MKLKYFTMSVFVVLGLFSVAFSASAHVLKTDGSIGAVLHVDPDDSPIVGKPATFFFEFKDKAGKFQGSLCDCNATVSENGKQLHSAELFTSGTTADLNTPMFSFTFPEKAIYTIEVTGKPKNGANFQIFDLKYDVRVDRQDSAAAAPSAGTSDGFSKHWLHLILFGGAFLVLLVLYLQERRKAAGSAKKTPPSGAGLAVLAAIVLTSFALHATMLDGVLCFHQSPAMHDHQCCVNPVATTVPHVQFAVAFASKGIQISEKYSFQKEFNLLVSNKSPPGVYA